MRGLFAIAIVGCCASGVANARDGAPLPNPVMTTLPLREHASYRLAPGVVRGAYELDRLASAGVRALRFERTRYRPSPLDAKFEWKTSGSDSRFGLAGAVGKVVKGLGQ